MLGFDALGRLALGQFSSSKVAAPAQAVGVGVARALTAQVSSFTFSGVAGIGTAGTIQPKQAAAPTQAAGVGLARALNSLSVTISIGQSAGTGVARAIASSIADALTGAAGIGRAGTIGQFNVAVTLPAAAGVGVARAFGDATAIALPPASGVGAAGAMAGPNVVLNKPFFGGFDGLVSGRFALGQIRQAISDGGISISITLPSAVGGGVARDLIRTLVGASGVGLTNWIAPPPYTFVDLLHFDSYPVRALPDMTAVSVVLGSAVGGGVAGQIRTMVSGGGTSGDGERRKNTGFEPIKKLPPAAPVVADRKPAPLPPYRSAPALVPETSPLDLVDRNLIPTDLLGLQDQIHTAQDIADIKRFLLALEQDEQDAADIADVLAILDQELA